MTLRLPAWLIARLFDVLVRRVAEAREPDFVIGDSYLRRWWVVPRNRRFNVYLHEIRKSDDDRALHDHPWVNCSILLKGRYVEHTIAAGGVNQRVERQAGEVVFRRPSHAHRLEMVGGESCWTLFLTGPTVRSWGFHCPAGWRHWKIFTSADGRSVGRGCGEADQ
ncbi:hypothetical protein [Methylopila sp. M107]|uniref:hypothetical protein n=1 Tax=Methylopila sp. M107 TaxID=1101190 RepID=UPI00037E71D4|nr:hypothetical protein [Methylopila sp. M107]